MFQVNNLSVRFGDKQVLNDINFTVEENDWYMIVGPNGVGKSTIVNAISGGVDYQGEIFFQKKNIQAMSSKEKGRKIGILTQQHHPSYGFSVEEVVALGRYAYHDGWFQQQDRQDHIIIDEMLDKNGLNDLRKQSVLTLSGGELQRVFLAQLMVQNPQVMILDEPANHLDIVYQEQLYQTVSRWLEQPGRCVISIMHDLNVAKKMGDKGLLLGKDDFVKEGEIDEVLSREHLKDVFQIDIVQVMKERFQYWL